MKLETLPILLGMTAIMSCECSNSNRPSAPVRTEVQPLLDRLNLPSATNAARWVAVSQYTDFHDNPDDDWIPGPSDFVLIYASIAVTQQNWASLLADAPPSSAKSSILIPKWIGELLLPEPIARSGKVVKRTTSKLSVVGTLLDSSKLSKSTSVRVRQAARLGDTLFLEIEDWREQVH